MAPCMGAWCSTSWPWLAHEEVTCSPRGLAGLAGRTQLCAAAHTHTQGEWSLYTFPTVDHGHLGRVMSARHPLPTWSELSGIEWAVAASLLALSHTGPFGDYQAICCPLFFLGWVFWIVVGRLDPFQHDCGVPHQGVSWYIRGLAFHIYIHGWSGIILMDSAFPFSRSSCHTMSIRMTHPFCSGLRVQPTQAHSAGSVWISVFSDLICSFVSPASCNWLCRT